jgi:hypothetical protein
METAEYKTASEQVKELNKELDRLKLEVKSEPNLTTGKSFHFSAEIKKFLQRPSSIAILKNLDGTLISKGRSTYKYDVFTDVHGIPNRAYIHCSALFDESLKNILPESDYKIIERADKELRKKVPDQIHSKVYFFEVWFNKDIAKASCKTLSTT